MEYHHHHQHLSNVDQPSLPTTMNGLQQLNTGSFQQQGGTVNTQTQPNNPFLPTTMMVGDPTGGIGNSFSTHPNMVYPETLLAVSNMVGVGGNNKSQQSNNTAEPSTTTNDMSNMTMMSMGLPPPMHSNPNHMYQQQQHPQHSQQKQQTTTLGGIPIPPLPPNSTTAMQVQIAAAAAAAAAVPPKGNHAPMGISDLDLLDPCAFDNHPPCHQITSSSGGDMAKQAGGMNGKARPTKRGANNTDLTPEEKKKLNRDRNRQHARSTRLRKKAYIEKLKQLVDGLHAERSEQDRKRRVEVQHLAEVHKVRRGVICKFLRFHAGGGGGLEDEGVWGSLVEEDFFLKQPVTPYRSFRCGEIEMSSERECRRSRGIEAILGDAASMAIMVESVGSRSARWMQIKRDEYLSLQDRKNGNNTNTLRPRSHRIPQNTRVRSLNPAVSSLSSSSRAESNSGSSSEEERAGGGKSKSSENNENQVVVVVGSGRVEEEHGLGKTTTTKGSSNSSGAKQVSSSSSVVSGSSGSNNQTRNSNKNNNRPQQTSNNDYHDYHAQPLPDPKLDSGNSSSGSANGSDSPTTESRNGYCPDSSSGDEERSSQPQQQQQSQHTNKKRRLNSPQQSAGIDITQGNGSTNDPMATTVTTETPLQPPTEATHELDVDTVTQTTTTTTITTTTPQPVRDPIAPSTTSTIPDPTTTNQRPPHQQPPQRQQHISNLPANIARSGGISHNIRPIAETTNNESSININARLSSAPLVPLPPFVGIGKRAVTTAIATGDGSGSGNSTTATTIVQNPGVRMMISSNMSSSNGSELATTQQQQGGGVPTPVFPPHDISSSCKMDGESSSSGTDTKGGRGGMVQSTHNVTSLIGAYNDNCSEDSSSLPSIQAYYHINEDDMLLTEDVLMCPFIFRTQDAVLCGALAECVMPGMLRAQFSERNKLSSLEMVFDAMGFMQQLERASGNEGTAQIIPNSLEMALQPSSDARVITEAQPPFSIVSVNEIWTQTTRYTQMEVEGKQLSLLNGPRTDSEVRKRPGKPPRDLGEVAKGRPSCAVNVYYDKNGTDFIAFVSSFPLANPEDKVTHILHTFKKLPEATTVEFAADVL